MSIRLSIVPQDRQERPESRANVVDASIEISEVGAAMIRLHARGNGSRGAVDAIDDEYAYLQDVPFYGQGWDMACGYYCALMVRVALGGSEVWKKLWTENMPLTKHQMAHGLSIHEVRSIVGEEHLERERDSDVIAPAVIAALREGRPSIIRLPESDQHPWGHYVVSKGFLKSTGKTGRRTLLIVNDPLAGENAINENMVSVAGTEALIARNPTALFRGSHRNP